MQYKPDDKKLKNLIFERTSTGGKWTPVGALTSYELAFLAALPVNEVAQQTPSGNGQ